VTTDDGKAAAISPSITRDDGRRQWAFDGKPLYFNATDSRPGIARAAAPMACGRS
jgi:predicted lipoprotein with Yx(FWY)xxD motif